MGKQHDISHYVQIEKNWFAMNLGACMRWLWLGFPLWATWAT
jgi:hypothetical protein